MAVVLAVQWGVRLEQHRAPAAAAGRRGRQHPSTLLLFTDGLVERRDQDIDTGLDDLAERAARLATAPLEELCDALISRSAQVFDDDVAVLALRTPSGSPSR